MTVNAIVAHHVADYDEWYGVFKEHGEIRRQHGAAGHIINRGVEDPNQIVAVTEFTTVEQARAFMTDPSLRAAMERAGVDSEPTIYLVEQAEEERY
jgi:heme-degrading monooxygenase HmoA